jgi:hypothetical protein
MIETHCATHNVISIRRAVLLALSAALGGGFAASSASAQEWVNPGTADWFEPANWNPAAVPGAGSSPVVSNGGTATLSGVAETPFLSSLNVGLGGSGTGVGAVESNGVKIRAGTFNVGTVSSAGDTGKGDLSIAGAGAAGSSLNVGFIIRPPGAATAIGRLYVEGALPLTGGFLQAGQMFLSGRGSVAEGTVEIGGDAGTVGGFLIVGNVTGEAGQAGSSSTGALRVKNGGGLALSGSSSVYVGTTVGTDREVEGPDVYVSRGTGTVVIDGTLRFTGSPGFFGIGYTSGGIADGALDVGALDMGASTITALNIGNSSTGEATGSMTVGGGTLRAGNVFIGTTSTGSAHGSLALTNTLLEAGSVLAGFNGGIAHLAFTDSDGTVSDDFRLLGGSLSLTRSLLDVGDEFVLGDEAALMMAIEGPQRGDFYGAIDAAVATLAGELQVDFTGLLPFADTMVFDLLRSGSAGGISGDFANLSFIGLLDGYSLLAGIELDGVEVYRLRLSRIEVPEPGSLGLLLLSLGTLGAFGRASRRER